MSDFCCQFSFVFPVPNSHVGWVREVVEIIENATPGEDLTEGDPLLDLFPDWDEWGEAGFDIGFNPDTWQCSVYSDHQGNTENVDIFLEAFLTRCYEADQEFREIGYSWAVHGDGIYEGGACRVFTNGSKVEKEYITTDGWLSNAFAGKGN